MQNNKQEKFIMIQPVEPNQNIKIEYEKIKRKDLSFFIIFFGPMVGITLFVVVATIYSSVFR